MLGLLSEPEAVAAKVIVKQGVALDAVREAAIGRLPVPDVIPFDADARKVLELTFREALRLGHNYVGTEHVLLALLELEDDTGVLRGLGIDKARVVQDVIVALTSIVAGRTP